MSKKFYFQKGEEMCHPLDYHKDFMKENGLKSLELFRAKRETSMGYFFCTHFLEAGEVGQTCGKQCEEYKPNNGKNGRCKHYGYCYEQTEEKIILVLIEKNKNEFTIVQTQYEKSNS